MAKKKSMTELINIKAPGEHCAVVLWQRHPDHPAGEVYVTEGMVVVVALTDEVQQRLATGRIVQTDEPATPPLPGYDDMTVADVVEALAGIGDIERIIVRQYETAHKNRVGILG